MEYTHVVHEFGPVYDARCEILILGSFPSVKSREVSFYYGHPQNRFWKVTAGIFGEAPPETVEADLREAQMLAHDPMGKLTAHLQGLPEPGSVRRVFLTGANPFALSFGRLRQIAELIAHYLPACETIGCFARVTDVARKTDGELEALRGLGYAGLSIGVETGDGPSLEFMDKGYGPGDIVEQSRRLDGAGIAYHFMYLAGLPGAGRGVEGAVNSAEIFNRTHPRIIGSSMLTIFPESALYQEIQQGNWREESEREKLRELRALVAGLEIPTRFATLGASNAVWAEGKLPQEKARVLAALDDALATQKEESLRLYRETLPHL